MLIPLNSVGPTLTLQLYADPAALRGLFDSGVGYFVLQNCELSAADGHIGIAATNSGSAGGSLPDPAQQ